MPGAVWVTLFVTALRPRTSLCEEFASPSAYPLPWRKPGILAGNKAWVAGTGPATNEKRNPTSFVAGFGPATHALHEPNP